MRWKHNGHLLEIDWKTEGTESLIGRIDGKKAWTPLESYNPTEAKRSMERMVENEKRHETTGVTSL